MGNAVGMSDAAKESPHTSDIPDPHGEPEFGAQPQPEGKVGATSQNRRDDPITGKPLYDDDSPQTSSSIGGDRYRPASEKGVDDASKRPATGEPSSTPRKEKELREL